MLILSGLVTGYFLSMPYLCLPCCGLGEGRFWAAADELAPLVLVAALSWA